MSDFTFPKLFSYGHGWKFRLMVFNNDFDDPIFTDYFNAPSMVLARKIVSDWRTEFIIQNGIIDDLFIYDLYNLSLGHRRKIE